MTGPTLSIRGAHAAAGMAASLANPFMHAVHHVIGVGTSIAAIQECSIWPKFTDWLNRPEIDTRTRRWSMLADAAASPEWPRMLQIGLGLTDGEIDRFRPWVPYLIDSGIIADGVRTGLPLTIHGAIAGRPRVEYAVRDADILLVLFAPGVDFFYDELAHGPLRLDNPVPGDRLAIAEMRAR